MNTRTLNTRTLLSSALAAGLLASLLAPVAQAAVGSYELPITRDAKTVTMVAYDFWSGEYPTPIANVSSEITGGSTKIEAFKSLRKLDQPVSCTIKNGIYHPWSKNTGSLLKFYTIAPVISYEATTDTKVGVYKGMAIMNIAVNKGEKIKRELYLSENACQADFKGQVIEYVCSDLANNTDLNRTSGEGEMEQWLYVKCAEGYKAFVQDESLMKQPGVAQGQITDYGSVAP